MTETTTPEPTNTPIEPANTDREPGSAHRLHSVLAAPLFQSSLTFVAFMGVFVGYGGWLGRLFLNSDSRLFDVHQNTPVLLVGLAVMVTLIAGQFDLSVASMATFTTYLTVGLVVKQDWPFPLVLAACLALGVGGGLLNALLIVGLRVNAFIATLGTGGVFVGLSRVYSGGSQLSPSTDTPQLPLWFQNVGSFSHKAPSWIGWLVLAGVALAAAAWVRHHRPRRIASKTWDVGVAVATALVALAVVFATSLPDIVGKMSLTIVLLLAVGLGLWVLLAYTTFGRYLYATGGNSEAARLAGVRTARETTKAFVLGGFLAALAGIVLAGIQGSASPDVATSFLLPAFAAAFLSTVLLSTGRFHVWGTIIGGIFLIWVSQGLIVGGLPFTWTDVVNGVVLVLAVALSTVLRRSSLS